MAAHAYDTVLQELTTINKAYFPPDELITHIFGRLQVLRPGPSIGTAEHSNTLQLAFGARHANGGIFSSLLTDFVLGVTSGACACLKPAGYARYAG